MFRPILFILPLLVFGGCLCDSQTCRYPNPFQPGHITEQQKHAQKFDPFTSQEIGPKIVGDRPSGALDPTPAFQRYPER